MWMQECTACSSAQVNGIHAWMKHLTENHALPTEWPSDRVGRLTGQAAMKPYTTITESKKRRRKDAIPRPLNSFMLFAQHIRRNVLRVFNEASNSAISQQLGNVWRTVPRSCKNRYDEEAARLVKIHQLEFPNYKYQPKKRIQPQFAQTSFDNNSETIGLHRSPKAVTANTVSPSSGSSPVMAPDSPASVHSTSNFLSIQETSRNSWMLQHQQQQQNIYIKSAPKPTSSIVYHHDSAYSSRKNSCTSSLSSSPHVTEFSTPIKLPAIELKPSPSKRAFTDGVKHVRQRFASATNGASKSPTQRPSKRPASCSLSPPDPQWSTEGGLFQSGGVPRTTGALKRILPFDSDFFDSCSTKATTTTMTTPVLVCYGEDTMEYILAIPAGSTLVTNNAGGGGVGFCLDGASFKRRPLSCTEKTCFDSPSDSSCLSLSELNGQKDCTDDLMSYEGEPLSCPSNANDINEEYTLAGGVRHKGTLDSFIKSEEFENESYFDNPTAQSEGEHDSSLSDNGFFDENLDTMMQSIDITTFLPGALSGSDVDFSESRNRELGSPNRPAYSRLASQEFGDILNASADLMDEFGSAISPFSGTLSPDLECLDPQSLLKI